MTVQRRAVTASALIRDEEGRVLLVREGYGKRRFGPPGGSVDEGEAPADAAVRETLEETGLSVTVVEEIGVLTLMRGDGSVNEAHAFACEIIDGTPSVPEGSEVAEIGWFDPYRLPQPMTFLGPHAIADFAAGRRGVTRAIDISGRVTEVHEIGHRRVSIPMDVRAAASWAAQFVVRADVARSLVEPTGLSLVPAGINKTIATIAFVRYEDSDLDAYNEVAIGLMVRAHDAPAGLGVYVHRMPVDQTFTLEAGRAIWGYPKSLAEISIEGAGGATVCSWRQDGSSILDLSVDDAGPVPLPARTPPTYTFLDGVLRRTEWEMPGVHVVRARFGGATLRLGDHPIADELRALGLPKRALMTQSIPRMRARFGPATVVTS